MSFICQKCNKVAPKNVPQAREVMETRPIVYPIRAKANRDGSNDNGGKGTAIVRERVVGPCCA